MQRNIAAVNNKQIAILFDRIEQNFYAVRKNCNLKRQVDGHDKTRKELKRERTDYMLPFDEAAVE